MYFLLLFLRKVKEKERQCFLWKIFDSSDLKTTEVAQEKKDFTFPPVERSFEKTVTLL